MTPASQGRDGVACVARQYSGTLGKIANCQVAVSVHLVNEHASCAADWRLFCPESWDDAALADPVAAARARRRREQARIPGEVRHTEKWRLALEMLDEMAGPGGWGILEQVTAAGGAGRRWPPMRATATTPPSGSSWRPAAGNMRWQSGEPPARTPVTRSR